MIGIVLIVRALRPRRYLHGWTADFIASPEFLKTDEWASVRYQALAANDGRCELCGRSKHDGPGIRLNVDHIKPRAKYPALALAVSNLQVLCGGTPGSRGGNSCNKGKGNRFEHDWRHPKHPHRPRARWRFW